MLVQPVAIGVLQLRIIWIEHLWLWLGHFLFI
jgi:hypothetical protein